MNKQFFAQKGIVVNSDNEVLFVKYADSKFLPNKLNGKWALPGGKIDMGETPQSSIIREVEEETGVICEPLNPFYVWNWEYEKDHNNIQINAVMVLCEYKSGELSQVTKQEGELDITEVAWIPISELDKLDIVFDEKPGIDIFLQNHKAD